MAAAAGDALGTEEGAGFPSQDGILLVNLGTPAAPEEAAVRSFLAEFLSDPRVVAIPRFIWLPLLHCIILRRRPAISAKKYQAIWMTEGSPLDFYTRRQANLLRTRLREHGVDVEWAMRYGKPSIADALSRLRGCRRIIVLPLYPQFSESTTESVRDCVPESTRFVESFHDHPAYIGAVASGIRRFWDAHGEPDVLLMSFHGLPQRSIDRGDPYKRQCVESAHLIADTLGLKEARLRISFQSRFGRARWIQPYTTDVLAELGRAAVGRVDVACPGFTADCLETLEEIAIEGRAIFTSHGGGAFNLIPCLNDASDWIDALSQIALEHCGKPQQISTAPVT